ncbi:MAG: sodium/solute symporter [Peptococcia bacterium]
MLKILLVGIFVAVLLASGLYSMRKTRNLGDFYLGGRDIGPWMSAFAYGTTYFSAVIFVGYAGKVGWGFGIGGLWIAIGNALIGSFLAWKILAKPTRVMTEKLGAMTMPELLEGRYDSKALKIFSSAIIFIFMVPYSASVFMGLSYVFEGVFNIPYNYILIFMAVITAIYLLMGGYRAIALTDFIQGIVMLFGVGVLLYYVFGNPAVGGLGQIIPRLKAISPELVNPLPTGEKGLALFSVVLLTSLGPWGLPQMVQKFYAIKDKKNIRAATVISTLFALIIGVGAYGVGSVARLYFSELPVDPATGVATVDLLVPGIINVALPELAAVLILLLILSASMSTLSSLVLVSSSTLSVDLLKGFVKPEMSNKDELLITRILCFIFVMLSVVLAMVKPTIILSLMALSWGTIAGIFLGPYIWGLFWPKTTKAGAWSGIIVGLIISVLYASLHNFDGNATTIGGALAMLSSLVIVPVVSLFTTQYATEHLEKVYAE